MRLPGFELRQCLFGEHLLAADNSMPVAVVESEKTAVICSALLPCYTWLACGSLTNLNARMCGPLKGRKVVLYPDLGAYDKWCSKAGELSHIRITVSALLEQKATTPERQQGADLADYLLAGIEKDPVLVAARFFFRNA